MNGLWRCAKYAFSPNKLKYCGPDKNQELAGYLKTKTSDLGLKEMLRDFAAMWSYLKLIAKENGIADEFNEQVVEAYWLGNELLETVSLKSFYSHTIKRLPKKELKWFEFKLPLGAKPNHSFHVLNFWKRTGHLARLHTLETMDNCRISAGEILRPQQLRRAQSFATPLDVSSGVSPDILRATFAVGRNLPIQTNKLVFKNKQLSIEPTVKQVQVLEGKYKPGDLVTIHWNWVCEKISEKQKENLEKYTKLALSLANLTI